MLCLHKIPKKILNKILDNINTKLNNIPNQIKFKIKGSHHCSAKKSRNFISQGIMLGNKNSCTACTDLIKLKTRHSKIYVTSRALAFFCLVINAFQVYS